MLGLIAKQFDSGSFRLVSFFFALVMLDCRDHETSKVGIVSFDGFVGSPNDHRIVGTGVPCIETPEEIFHEVFGKENEMLGSGCAMAPAQPVFVRTDHLVLGDDVRVIFEVWSEAQEEAAKALAASCEFDQWRWDTKCKVRFHCSKTICSRHRMRFPLIGHDSVESRDELVHGLEA